MNQHQLKGRHQHLCSGKHSEDITLLQSNTSHSSKKTMVNDNFLSQPGHKRHLWGTTGLPTIVGRDQGLPLHHGGTLTTMLDSFQQWCATSIAKRQCTTLTFWLLLWDSHKVHVSILCLSHLKILKKEILAQSQ